MLVGIMGKMGTGKTLAQTILAAAIHRATGLPIYSNYEFKNDEHTRIKKISDIWEAEQGIFCFDEIWLTLDSRLWSNNVALTRWVNQTRKKKLLVFYTTQHISQVEMRVRKATDVLIYTERKHGAFRWNFIDYQYGQLGRRYVLRDPARFYNLYDTYEVLEPIKLDKYNKSDYNR